MPARFAAFFIFLPRNEERETSNEDVNSLVKIALGRAEAQIFHVFKKHASSLPLSARVSHAIRLPLGLFYFSRRDNLATYFFSITTAH